MNNLKAITVTLVITLLLVTLPSCTAKRKNGSRKSSSKDCDVKAALEEMRAEIGSLASEVKQLKHQVSETCGVGAPNSPLADTPDTIHHDSDFTPGCMPHEFQCNDGSCIDGVLHCDLSIDCADAEDETFCYNVEDEVSLPLPKDPVVGDPLGPVDYENMDHGGENMDHGGMDHGDMDHGGMDQGNQSHHEVITATGVDSYDTTESPNTATTTPPTTIPTTTTTTASTTTTTVSTTTTTTLPPPEGPPPEVPDCVPPYLQVGHSCFYTFTYFEDWRSWGEANAKCQTMGGTLASPWNFLDLQKFVMQRYTTTFWVGIQFNTRSKTWTWLSGKKMAKEFWKPGQPSRGAKRCAYLDYNSNYKAVSHYCGEKFPFVCEQKA